MRTKDTTHHKSDNLRAVVSRRCALESTVIIRNYVKASDLQGCALLLRELTEWHAEMYQRPAKAWGPIETDYDRDLDTLDPSLFWVAVHNSKIIGLVGLLLHENGDEAEVEPIMVTREFRGKGIGERLLETAVAEARLRRSKLVFIKHLARNIETIQFSYKHGFTNIGYIELLMDLSERSRKPGPRMFGRDFNM